MTRNAAQGEDVDHSIGERDLTGQAGAGVDDLIALANAVRLFAAGLVFPRANSRAPSPDWVSEQFQVIAKAAGLPVIKLHEARHTAATLGLEAGLDMKIISVQLGRSTTTITRDLYQHVRQAVLANAAEKIVALIPQWNDSHQARS